MQLSPRYGDDPIITLDGSPGDILEPAVRQRRRLAATLGLFTDEQWAHPSRCEGWSNRDVIIHLDSTNSFWAYSVSQGLAGEPTRFLSTFDPVASPAALVAGAGDVSAAEVLDRFVASSDALVASLEAIDEVGWSVSAEAPPGHISISALAHHALWDSWVHERDILLPLGLTPDEEADEIAASLRYVAALSPAFGVNSGSGERGILAVSVTDPDVAFVVDIADCAAVRGGTDAGDLVLTGDAVELLEALSTRRPLDQPIPAETSWMVTALAEIFEIQPA